MEHRVGRTITRDANEFIDVLALSATAERCVTAEDPSIRVDSEHQPRRQRLAVQGRAV